MSTAEAADTRLRNIVEAALFTAGRPLSIRQLQALFVDEPVPSSQELSTVLHALRAECQGRGLELREVASGWRYQARTDYAPWLARLWPERPARYSRALLETLVLIAYRQPITRGEIEDIRGVAVSTHIIKTLQEREWIRVIGQRDVPGRPALFGTTRQFLDYFNLHSLDELPPLAEVRDAEDITRELLLAEAGAAPQAAPADGDPGSAATMASGAEAQVDAARSAVAEPGRPPAPDAGPDTTRDDHDQDTAPA